MGTELSQLQLQISGTPCPSVSDSHCQLQFLKSSLKHTCIDWLFNVIEVLSQDIHVGFLQYTVILFNVTCLRLLADRWRYRNGLLL